MNKMLVTVHQGGLRPPQLLPDVGNGEHQALLVAESNIRGDPVVAVLSVSDASQRDLGGHQVTMIGNPRASATNPRSARPHQGPPLRPRFPRRTRICAPLEFGVTESPGRRIVLSCRQGAARLPR